MKYFVNFFMDVELEEGKYLVRMVLGMMCIGVVEGIFRDVIVEVFRVKLEFVERVYMLMSDFGYVVKIVKFEGNEGFLKVRI